MLLLFSVFSRVLLILVVCVCSCMLMFDVSFIGLGDGLIVM